MLKRVLMIETNQYTLFKHRLIGDEIYALEGDVNVEPANETNMITAISRDDKKYRAITEKHITWWHTTVGEDEDEIIYTSRKITSSLNELETQYLMSVSDTNKRFYGFSAHGRGCYDIRRIVYDELFSSYDRWFVCSSSSGIWILTLTHEEPMLGHIDNSPCCVNICMNKLIPTAGYIVCANMECFDSYTYTKTTSGSSHITTIISTKNFREETVDNNNVITSADDCVYTQRVVAANSGTSVASQVYFTAGITGQSPWVNLTNVSKKIKWDYCTGWVSQFPLPNNSHLNIHYTNSTNEASIDIYFPLSFNVSSTYSPHGNNLTATNFTSHVATETRTADYILSITYGNTVKQDCYLNGVNKWGAIYYTSDLSTFTNWSSKLDNSLVACPSINKCLIAYINSQMLYFFLTDNHNDYLFGYDLLTDNTQTISHGQETWSYKWLKDNYHEGKVLSRFTSSTPNDDIVLLQCQYGCLTFAYSLTLDDILITTSPTITTGEGRPVYFTEVMEFYINNTVIDFGYDSYRNELYGAYRLDNAEGNEWYLNGEWTLDMTPLYHECTFYDINHAPLRYPAPVKTMLSNNSVIYAITAGTTERSTSIDGVWITSNGYEFYLVYQFRQQELVAAGFMQQQLVLVLNNATGSEIITINNSGHETDASINSHNTSISVIPYTDSSATPIVSAMKGCSNGPNMITCDEDDNLGIASLYEHEVNFNGPIYNTTTIDDISSKISELVNILNT